MAKFIITGGAGFIGSNIAEELVKRNHQVKIIDNLSSGRMDNLKSIRKKIIFVKGDIRDKTLLDKEFRNYDFVLHQAALCSVPKSVKYPKEYNEVNINGTLSVLEAASKAEIKRLVFASSSSIYGDSSKFPAKETDLPRLISPYALTKLTGEYYCRIFSSLYSLETVCLRYFNVFGPKQSIKDEYALVVPKFIQMIDTDHSPTVYGDGHQSRDFVYIGNIVEANILAATTPNIKHEVYNVANGQDFEVLDLVSNINKLLKKNVQPIFLDARSGDAYKTLGDIKKISKIGFQPTVSFQEGLAQTINWFKRQ